MPLSIAFYLRALALESLPYDLRSNNAGAHNRRSKQREPSFSMTLLPCKNCSEKVSWHIARTVRMAPDNA
jgi:hypothetical protein